VLAARLVRAISLIARRLNSPHLKGIMPKDFLLGLVRDETQPLDVRMEAAKAAGALLPRAIGSD
jgi:hypothetical protein